MLKLIFVARKFRLRRFQKRGKREKNEKLRFAKNIFLFLRVHELDIILRVNTDRKNRVGKVCSDWKFRLIRLGKLTFFSKGCKITP